MSEPTDTITIRVPKHLKENLEDICKKNQVNLNLLINQILSKNIQWDKHITNMGWLQLHPSVVKEVFAFLNETQILELAESIKKDIINGIRFIYQDTSLQHTVEFIETWLISTNTQFRYTKEKESHKFLVNHKLGENWSIFASKITEKFVLKLGYKFTDSNTTPDSYSFTISQ